MSELLAKSAPQLQEWLDKAAKQNPYKALDIWIRLSERFTPSLSRTEVTGADGEAFAPVTINIPVLNLPKQAEPPLPILPGEAAKQISEPNPGLLTSGEGTPAEIPMVPGQMIGEAASETGEDLQESPGEGTLTDLPEFQFVPELKVSAPPGYKREF